MKMMILRHLLVITYELILYILLLKNDNKYIYTNHIINFNSSNKIWSTFNLNKFKNISFISMILNELSNFNIDNKINVFNYDNLESSL